MNEDTASINSVFQASPTDEDWVLIRPSSSYAGKQVFDGQTKDDLKKINLGWGNRDRH